MTLYAEDLAAILAAIEAAGGTVEILAEGRVFKNGPAFRDQAPERIGQLSVETRGPFMALAIADQSATLYVDTDDPKGYALYYPIADILERRQAKRYFPSYSAIFAGTYLAPVAALLLLADPKLQAELGRPVAFAEAAILAVLFLLAAGLNALGFYRAGSVVWPRAHSPFDCFFTRNRPRIRRGLAAGLVAAVALVLVIHLK